MEHFSKKISKTILFAIFLLSLLAAIFINLDPVVADDTIINSQSSNIQGTVSSFFAEPMAGVLIKAGSSSAITDLQGNYYLNVSAGAYTITASGFGYSYSSKDASASPGQTTTINFTLSQTDTTPPIRTKNSPTGILTTSTSQTIISLETNEIAVCKYSTSPNSSYSAMSNIFSFTNSVSHSQTIIGLVAGQSYVYYIRCNDASANANIDDYTISFSIAQIVPPADTIPPTLFSGSPFGTLPQGTTQINLTLSTSETAICKYSTIPNVLYASMANIFSSTSSNLHSQTVVGLINGTSHDYYIRCQDTSNNTTASDYPISFSVANPPPLSPLPPFRSSGSPFGILRQGTTHANLSLATNESAVCKYSTSPNTSYSSMISKFINTSSASHSQPIENLASGTSYTYYVKCQGVASNVSNTDDYIISFSVDQETPLADIVPPVRSNSSPSGIFSAETTQAILALSTNEKAICKYSTVANVGYPLMTNFLLTADSLFHSQTIASISKGQSYIYYVRCQDTAFNINLEDYIISFSVANLPAVILGGGANPSDTTPPSAVTNLVYSSTETQVFLTWTNPTNGDYVKTKILRKTGSFPLSPVDGTMVFDDNKNSFTDSNLSSGTTYYYSVYAYDFSGNYSLSSKITLATKGTFFGTSYPDSTLFKTPDSIRVYVVIRGKKKWIATPEVFETLSYKWTSITLIDTNTLKSIPDFEDNLIRANGTTQVYLVVNGIRHHIPNPDIFLNYGFLWSDVKDVPQTTVDQYRLVRLVRESGQSEVYYLSSFGTKKWIPSPEVFSSYNNHWSDIQVISKKEMDSYPTSNLMKLADSSDIYLIEGSYKRLIPSVDIFNKYQYDPALVLEANQAEFNWYQTGMNAE